MCLNVKKIIKNGKYKETTYKGEKGQKYSIETWQKCGHCEECQEEKKINWIIRNYYEAKAHEDICFITLTYEKNPFVLIKKDAQDFLKRLRKEIYKNEKKNIRFFLKGEYGTLNGRPHYHAIIYNWKEKKPIYKGINKKGNLIFSSETIQKCWKKGIISYQHFNHKEIPYLIKYQVDEDKGRETLKIKKEIYNKEKEKLLIKEKNAEKLKKLKLIKIEKLFEIYKNNERELERLQKKFENSKSKFVNVKPFLLWSLSLGWNEYLKDYDNTKKTMKNYIDEKEYLTPSSYLKKLANLGDYHAIQELEKRRNFEIDRAETEDKRKILKKSKQQKKDLKQKIYWHKIEKDITIF